MNMPPQEEGPSQGSRHVRIIVILLLLVIAAAMLYVGWQAREPGPRPLEVPPPVASSPVPVPETTRVPSLPLPRTVEPPLPSLDDSDDQVMADLGRLFAGSDMASLLLPDQLLRKIVIIADNLLSSRLPVKYLPVRPPPGRLRIAERDGRIFLDAANYTRYRLYVRLLESLDVSDFMVFLVRYRPLFQRAYEELGYSEARFEGRFLAVIDDLLQTPEIEGPVELIQPSVYYKYADPALESLSSGQKLLLRMGPANARIVKDTLRRIRAAMSQP